VGVGIMDTQQIKNLLEQVSCGEVTVTDALGALRDFPLLDIGHTKIDSQRRLRNGFPEVIYGAGKTALQIREIFAAMMKRSDVLATRVSPEAAGEVLSLSDSIVHNPAARTLTYRAAAPKYRKGKIAIVTAGTSDLAVAEEARVTADMLGSRTELISDVGVAGIHRLIESIDLIREAAVVIVIAGMEGALASVVGGLIEAPLIAVPTSVGYGAAFDGIAALLGMLTSCASGITVVNIDNGFGAACAATRINKSIAET
jgi:NCAIR mutase (PurE)-related protein